LLRHVCAAQRPTEHSLPALVVTPSTSITFRATGRPVFAVAHRIPRKGIDRHRQILDQDSILAYGRWSFGSTDIAGITITLRLSASASTPGTFGPAIAFTNVPNGRGGAGFPAKLTVQGPPSPPRPAGEAARGAWGDLLDSRGGIPVGRPQWPAAGTVSRVYRGRFNAAHGSSLFRLIWARASRTGTGRRLRSIPVELADANPSCATLPFSETWTWVLRDMAKATVSLSDDD
jgi:hypothetical protein